MADNTQRFQTAVEKLEGNTAKHQIYINGKTGYQTDYGEYVPSLPEQAAAAMAGLKAYGTYAEMMAVQGTVKGQIAKVANDADSTKNGEYAWDGTKWVKSVYDPLTQAKQYTDDKNTNISNSIWSSTDQVSIEFLRTTKPWRGNFRYAGSPESNQGTTLYVLPTPATQKTTLQTMALYSTLGSGTVTPKIFVLNAGTFTAIRELPTVNVYRIGLNTFDFSSSPIVMQANEYIGFQTIGANRGVVTYTITQDTSSIKYYANATYTGNQVPESLVAKTGVIDCAFYEKSLLSAFEAEIGKLNTGIEASLSSINATAALVQKIGKQSALIAGTGAGAGQCVVSQPVTTNSRISKFSTQAIAAGFAEVCVYTKSADTNKFTLKSSQVVKIAVGLNNINVNLAVNVGDYVGVKGYSTGWTTYATDENFNIFSSPTLGNDDTLSGPNANWTWQFSFELKQATTSSQKWLGKKYVSFGDSITWYNGRSYAPTHLENGQVAIGYQSYVVAELGCTLDNKGESGWTMPEIYASRINTYDFTGVHAVTITSGANDHRKAVAVGTVAAIGAAFNTATYAGAIQASIEKIIASNKDTKIFLITPIRGWYSESGTTNVPGPYKGEMMISVDYANAMKQIGLLYSIPVIDWYNEVGINDLNKNYYLGDNPAVFTAYLLHPNQKGFKKMGEMLVSALSKY